MGFNCLKARATSRTQLWAYMLAGKESGKWYALYGYSYIFTEVVEN